MTDSIEAVPSLTEAERVEEFSHLSPDDCGYIVTVLVASFPKVFDAALNELKHRPSDLDEVTL